MGMHSEFLYLMGGAATFTEGKSFSAITIMDTVGKALDAGEYYGDPQEDHHWISYGIDAYNAQNGRVQ